MIVIKSWNEEYEEYEEEEAMIVQQIESTSVMEAGVSHLLSEHLDKSTGTSPFYEVFDNLE